MAQTIKIKRSTGSAAPSTLASGELAYSKGSDTFYIGDPAAANTPIAIGGAIKNNAGTAQLATGITAAEIRTLVGVDAAGTDNSTNVSFDISITDVFALSGQAISGVDNGADGIVGWDDSAGKLTFLAAADIRTVAGLGSLATLSSVGTSNIANDAVTNDKIATDAVNSDSIAANAVGASEIAANAVGASELNVSGNGTAGQALVSDGDGTFSFSTISVTDNDVNVANLTARLPQITSNVTIGDASDVTVTMAGDLTVTGDLTVSGTTTTINTETLTVDDNIIVLNNNASGSPTENAGLEVERGSSTNVIFRWNESNDRWEFTNNGSTFYNLPISTEYTNHAEPGIFSGGGTPTLASGVTAAEIRTLIGAGTSSTTGTVTSVAISSTDGSISGTGTITTSGTFDLEVATIDGGTY